MRGITGKRMVTTLLRSNFCYIFIIGSLIFLAYLTTVIPSTDIQENQENSQGVPNTVLSSRPGSSDKINPDFGANHKRAVIVSPFKLKPPYLSEAGKGARVRETGGRKTYNESKNKNSGSEIKRLILREDMQEDYMGFINHAFDQDLQDPLLNKHKFKFLADNKHACVGGVFLLVLIHSAATKVKERHEIRNTWGGVKDYNGANIVPIFLLAKPSNNSRFSAILKESRIYNDIVIGDFIDHYRNLTYKNVMGLHWTMTFCNHTKFVLKTDDDTMIDMYHLMDFLFQKSPDGDITDFMYCSTFRNQGPVRRPGDKWFVTLKEYPYTKYPPYCEGFAYIMSLDVVRKLYVASKSVPFYWVDDVYVTGFLTAQAGIYHHDMENGHSYNLMQSEHLSKHVQSSIFLLAKYAHLRKNWERAWNDILAFNRITT